MHSLITSILFPNTWQNLFVAFRLYLKILFGKAREVFFVFILFCFFHILNSSCSKAIKDYVVMFYIRISIHLLFCCLLVQHVSFFIIKSTSNYVMFESRYICHGRGQYFTVILFELPLQ